MFAAKKMFFGSASLVLTIIKTFSNLNVSCLRKHMENNFQISFKPVKAVASNIK